MPDATAQTASPAFRLAAIDPDFLLGDSTRGVRFQLEYMKAQEALAAFGIRSTIVVFGSARVREDRRGNHGRWYSEARALRPHRLRARRRAQCRARRDATT